MGIENKAKEINVLPPAVFNLLAAGEVVENPASIVKEAVENSLDAGASEITVSIKGGGIDEICVIDNGCGVAAAEIHKVFLPHATSKVKNAKDLESIGTLGFRGEALSSIASVSKAEFISRTADEKTATRLRGDGSVNQLGSNIGTILNIRNLFYNTPARKKFLQSTRSEQNNVTGIIQKLILSNPELRFRYVADGDVYYDYKGGKLADAIELIYGKEIDILPVNAKRKDLKLTGYISRPSFTKKNRTWQTVMINRRAIEGGTVAKAVNEAFSNYLATGSFPFFVLNLEVDLGSIDVNVHPRKQQVKFEKDIEIFEFVKSAVTDVIDACFHDTVVQPIENTENDKQILDNIKYLSSTKSGTEKLFSGAANHSSVKSAPRVLNLLESAHETRVERAQLGLKRPQKLMQGEMTGTMGVGLDAKVLGSMFDTYVLLVSGDNFYIIDQHAAQERLLFDELVSQIDSGSIAVQMLFEPALLYLSPAEMNQMETAAPVLKSLGFECEAFGSNCFRIAAVPVAVSERGIDTVIGNVLRDTKGVAPSKLSALLKEKVVKECCKNAIKAGTSLTNEQIGYFLAAFKNQSMTPLCPHGRPVIISLTKTQIEKMFMRKG